jgi:hypothetical protein
LLFKTSPVISIERLRLPSWRDLGEAYLEVVASKIRSLVTLDVSGVRGLSDATCAKMIGDTGSLEVILAGGCLALTDATLVQLARSCPRLTRISFQGCRMITDAGVVELARHCPRLTYVDFTSCSSVGNAGLLALAKSCPKLETIFASRAGAVADTLLTALGSNCRQLRVLSIASSSPFSGHRALTDAGVAALARGCRGLQELSLRGASQLSPIGLAELGACVGAQMKRLDISCCSSLACDGASELASALSLFPALESLSLSGCVTSVTDETVRALAAGAARLAHLDLHQCKLVTEPALRVLLEALPILSKPGGLVVTGCGASLSAEFLAGLLGVMVPAVAAASAVVPTIEAAVDAGNRQPAIAVC